MSIGDGIQAGMLVVQILGLGGLITYVVQTMRLRKVAQKQLEVSREQVNVSQKLLEAAMDQVEGLARPCLTLASELRDARGTILELDNARGSTRARTKDGHFVFQNIGNGLALNVRYSFRPMDQPSGRAPMTGDGYFHAISTGALVQTVEPATCFTGEYEVIFAFESLGGRSYQTIVTMTNLVLTEFKFMQAPDGA